MQKNLVKLEVDQVDRAWDACAPILQRAIDRSEGYYDIDDLYQAVKKGHQDLWVMFDEEILLAGTTRLVHYPNKSVLEVLFVATKDNDSVDDFRSMMSQIEEWAKEQGAESTAFAARPGWKKLFPDFKLQHTLMTKDYEV